MLSLDGAVGEGGGQILPWYVGTPGMSSIVRPLAESVRIHTSRKVHTIERSEKAWHIWFDDETMVGPFAAVAVAVPAPQAQLLLGRVDEVSAPLSRVRMSPCWSLMVRLDQRMLPEQDVYSDMSDVIRWIARNNAKPGRSLKGETIVVHASPQWSRETEDAEPEIVAEELWDEVCHVLALPPVRPSQMTAHLWRFGLVEQSLGETYVYLAHPEAKSEGAGEDVTGGVFMGFLPQRIEALLLESKATVEEVKRLIAHGIDPVLVPDGDADHRGSVYG